MRRIILFLASALGFLFSDTSNAEKHPGSSHETTGHEALLHLNQLNSRIPWFPNRIEACGTNSTGETSILNRLTSKRGKDYEAEVLAMIRSDQFIRPIWSSIKTSCTDSENRKVTAFIAIATDALQLGNDSQGFLRVHASARLTEKIHRELEKKLGFELMMPTAKIIDEIHLQADFSATPCNNGFQPMDGKEAVKHHENCVQDQVSKFSSSTPSNRLISNVGKTWVLHVRHLEDPRNGACPSGGPLRAINYGWYKEKKKLKEKLQSLGACHNYDHSDYSQTIRLVQQDVLLKTEGVEAKNMKMADLLADPKLHACVSSSRLNFSKYRKID